MEYKIPHNKPLIQKKYFKYVEDLLNTKKMAGANKYSNLCENWIENNLNTKKAYITPSCTAALEMIAIIAKIMPGDEIIMPSYTFVSTANAFVLRGAIPVFVDIRPDTQNIDENRIEEAITNKTKAIVVVHYAGVCCEMYKINKIAKKYGLMVIEDAAQAILSEYKNRKASSLGDFGAISFHETKNIICGEAGAITINSNKDIQKAEIVREKGTNRSVFLRGEVDKYTWVDIGSSFLVSELATAFLYAQLQQAKQLIQKRVKMWNLYHKLFTDLEKMGFAQRPIVPKECKHNAHIYYLKFDNLKTRTKIINKLKEQKILSVFHYIPLHSSPAGLKYSRFVGSMENTNNTAETLLRLPIYQKITKSEIENIVNKIYNFF